MTTFYESCEDIIPEECADDWIMTNIAYVSYEFHVNKAPPESEEGWRRVTQGFIKQLESLYDWSQRAPVVDALLKYLCNLPDRPPELTELLIRKLPLLMETSATPMCAVLYESITMQPELEASISRAVSPVNAT